MHRTSPRFRAFTLVETMVVLAILALLFAITAQSVSKSYTQRYFSRELNSLRTVQMAILAYAEDQRHSGEAPIFPNRLEDLLPEYYLTEKDIDPSIVYIQPDDSAASDFVMLKRTAASGLLISTIQGPPQKAEQGAAANP